MKAQESIHGVVDVMGARDRFLGTSQGQSKNKKELKQTELKAPFGQWRISRRKWPTV